MAAGSAAAAERLFSLELLVDWVRLEARLLPAPPPEDGEDPGPPPAGALRLAVAFRLLDFPTLLVYPPGGPAAPSRAARPGSFPFGRGKSCLFRLEAASLRRLLGLSPLYTLLLTVPPGSPTPAPKLLGSCSISLAAAARGLRGEEGRGSIAVGASQGHRGLYILRDLMGQQVGQIYLGYRLTDLGSTLIGHIPPKTSGAFQGQGDAAGAGVSKVEEGLRTNESNPPASQERRLSPPHISFAQVNTEDLEEPKQQENVVEIVTPDKTKPKQQEYVVKIVETPHKCNRSDIDLELTDSSQSETVKLNEVRESLDSKNLELTELELETNVICPPPLYYSHLEPKKVPPAKGKFITVPQISALKESYGVVQEEKVIYPLVKNHDVSSNQNHVQSDKTQTAMAHSQSDEGRLFDPDKLDTIRQLPLLNALLLELSLLYDQPFATSTSIHPHLAWLYRPEDGKVPESSDNTACKTEEVGDKFLLRKEEKAPNPQFKNNQVGHKLKKGVCFEKNISQRKVVPRRKLFYGLTNTLKLRLKRTNPDMLILHEKREQYRKMQTEMPDKEKHRVPSSKGNSSTEEHRKPHTPPSSGYSVPNMLFAENIKTLKQDGVEFEGHSFTEETHFPGNGTEKEINVEIKENKDPVIERVNVTKPILPEKVTPRNVSERFKKEVKVYLPDIDTENTRIDSITDNDNGGNDRQVETVDDDFHSDSNDSKPSKNSHSESKTELQYSDDFTSPCYSEDFSSVDDTLENSRVHDSNPELETDNLSHSYLDTECKSSESRISRKSHRSEINSVLTPPFSAGSPVHSYKKSHLSKSQGKSLVDANSTSSSDISSHWSEGKKKQNDPNNIHNTEMKNTQDTLNKNTSRTGQKSLEKSQSLRTSQVSSYLPSNMSELELSALDSITSDQFEENDELGTLNICSQYKDICELVINKLPGYTV